MDTKWSSDIPESEKNILEMTSQNSQWIKTLMYAKEEIHFLEKFFKSNILKKYSPEINKKLNVFLEKLEDLNTQNTDLNLSLLNHQKDIQGIREVEDISSDTFYQEYHTTIRLNMEGYMENYNNYKLEIYTFTETLL